MEYIPKITPEDVRLDTAAAVRHLSPEGTHPVFTMGFCFGGGQSWRLAASDLRLAGAIGFYGRPAAALEVVDDVTAPVLMLVAGADHAIPVADSQALADALTAAGKDVEIHVYDGAPHSFFDRTFADHAAACDDAWRRILTFIDRLTG
jgi:carboxymethylenebutenolidase